MHVSDEMVLFTVQWDAYHGRKAGLEVEGGQEVGLGYKTHVKASPQSLTSSSNGSLPSSSRTFFQSSSPC